MTLVVAGVLAACGAGDAGDAGDRGPSERGASAGSAEEFRAKAAEITFHGDGTIAGLFILVPDA